EAGKAWYVPLDADRARCMEVLNKFKPVFENENIEKIGQNIKYDILVLAWHGIEVKGKLFDTMIAHYLIDADSRHNMDVLAENYLGYTCMPITDLIGKKGKKQGNMRDVPVEVISDYACEDADITFQLSEVFRPLLKEHEAHDLAQKVEFPLVYVLAGMEREG